MMAGPVGRGIVNLGTPVIGVAVVVESCSGITIGVGDVGFDPGIGMGGGPKGGSGSGDLGRMEMAHVAAISTVVFVGWTESAATVCSSNIPLGGVPADKVGDILLAIAAAVATAAAAAAIGATW